ncbi:hypothetical protein NDU88_000417 [Pleurodeles waltl]|uniref:Uncharacterized protein n=1 Tax=Pleurodeles waltl TaxID=8319 RepID=A0AAV7NAF1_PLEWA|nr:hypothetical protein NDU88_000417 [Pleurodeles waltl]
MTLVRSGQEKRAQRRATHQASQWADLCGRSGAGPPGSNSELTAETQQPAQNCAYCGGLKRVTRALVSELLGFCPDKTQETETCTEGGDIPHSSAIAEQGGDL